MNEHGEGGYEYEKNVDLSDDPVTAAHLQRGAGGE